MNNSGPEKWYYAINDAQLGPVSFDGLRALVLSGKLKSDNLVWTKGLESWQPASTIGGLFPQAVSLASEPRSDSQDSSSLQALPALSNSLMSPSAKLSSSRFGEKQRVTSKWLPIALVAAFAIIACLVYALWYTNHSSKGLGISSSPEGLVSSPTAVVIPPSTTSNAPRGKADGETPSGSPLGASSTSSVLPERPAIASETSSAADVPIKGQAAPSLKLSTQSTSTGNSTLEEVSPNLLWSQDDNGQEINWIEAKRYCSSRGEGWRLPSVDELSSIYDASGAQFTICGKFTCKVSPLFHLSAGGYWSNVEAGPSGAMVYVLDGGTTYQGRIDGKGNVRALCVRSLTLPSTIATASAAVPAAPAPNAGSPSTDHCEADAPRPKAPEEIALLSNGKKYLTGKSVRLGTTGKLFVVEAALGYDGMCRPSPYQIYVFNEGKLAGTLSSNAMQPRSAGAISNFKQATADSIEIEMEHYKPTDAACCPSSTEKKIVPLAQFIAATSSQSTAATAAITPPSFDCRKASTITENAICASQELSTLDGQLGRAFSDAYAFAAADQAKNLRIEQMAWIKKRNEECNGESDCLSRFLRSRIAELKASTSSVPEGSKPLDSVNTVAKPSVVSQQTMPIADRSTKISEDGHPSDGITWRGSAKCDAFKLRHYALKGEADTGDGFALQEMVHTDVAAEISGCKK